MVDERSRPRLAFPASLAPFAFRLRDLTADVPEGDRVPDDETITPAFLLRSELIAPVPQRVRLAEEIAQRHVHRHNPHGRPPAADRDQEAHHGHVGRALVIAGGGAPSRLPAL